MAESCRVLAPGGRFAFTASVAEGNAVAEIVDGAVAAQAVSVRFPDGPPFYRFADGEESRRAFADAGFDDDSFEIETVTARWRVPAAGSCSMQSCMQASARLRCSGRSRPRGLEAIREAITEGVQRHADGEGFALPIVARVISARSPR